MVWTSAGSVQLSLLGWNFEPYSDNLQDMEFPTGLKTWNNMKEHILHTYIIIYIYTYGYLVNQAN